jgi:ssDNA-binding Zn-finger/Zn-ribbon topoisomerase 1
MMKSCSATDQSPQPSTSLYDPKELDEVRCPDCKKLLQKAKLAKGSIVENYCRRCGANKPTIVY